MFLNAFIITWRESLEALLVVGILLAWANTREDAARYRRVVLAGVAGGVLCAILVAAGAMLARETLSGDALDIFQIVLLFAAWGLLTQMILWMHSNAKSMGNELRERARSAGNAWGVALVAGLAVAREGIETVMFLFGAFLQARGQAWLELAGGMVAGLGLACLVAAVGVRGSRYLRLGWLFRASEVLLLAIASAMLATGIDRVLGRDWLTMLADPMWDAGAWLDDTHGLGGILASFAGYRAQPSWLWGICYVIYLAFIAWRLWPRREVVAK
jgi:high-affinity iron transporter